LIILKREGVNGFAMNVDDHYFKACCYYVHEGSSRLSASFQMFLPSPYLICFSQSGRSKYLICPHSPSYFAFFEGFFVCLVLSPLVFSIFSPFVVGCFVLLMIGKFLKKIVYSSASFWQIFTP